MVPVYDSRTPDLAVAAPSSCSSSASGSSRSCSRGCAMITFTSNALRPARRANPSHRSRPHRHRLTNFNMCSISIFDSSCSLATQPSRRDQKARQKMTGSRCDCVPLCRGMRRHEEEKGDYRGLKMDGIATPEGREKEDGRGDKIR